MASIAHVTVGLAVGRLFAGERSWGASLVFAALSMLPDADVVSFALGIPYADPFGHRGATHSLVFAVGMGLLVAGVQAARGRLAVRAGLLAGAVVASHPLLDSMTTGGLGVALLWPWSAERYFAPIRPIPVAPIGVGFLSARGLKVGLTELLPTLPLVWFALRRGAARREAATGG